MTRAVARATRYSTGWWRGGACGRPMCRVQAVRHGTARHSTVQFTQRTRRGAGPCVVAVSHRRTSARLCLCLASLSLSFPKAAPHTAAGGAKEQELAQHTLPRPPFLRHHGHGMPYASLFPSTKTAVGEHCPPPTTPPKQYAATGTETPRHGARGKPNNSEQRAACCVVGGSMPAPRWLAFAHEAAGGPAASSPPPAGLCPSSPAWTTTRRRVGARAACQGLLGLWPWRPRGQHP